MQSYNEARDLYENSRKRKLAGNTWLVKTDAGFGVKLYDTIVVEYLDEHRIRLNTGGWRTVTTFKRIRNFTGHCIYDAGFRSCRSVPDNTVIDTRDFFIEYPNNVTKVQAGYSIPKPNTFEYVQMGKDFKPIKTITVNKDRLTSECWLVQFNGFEACKRCEFKGTSECGGQNIVKTGVNKVGVKITQTEGVK